VNLHYSRESVRLETAGGIVKALPLLGAGSFAVISADIWTDYDYRNLRAVDGGATKAHLVMVENPAHHQRGDFELQANGRLRLALPHSHGLTYSGISVMHPSLFAGLEEAPLALRPVLDKAIALDQISAETLSERWFDIGTPERLAALETLLSASC
jgi:MurNAc alpha-1-phosphate uridylyltransferase